MSVVILGNGVAANAAASAIRASRRDLPITMVSAEAHPHYSACVLPHYLSGELARDRVFLKTAADYAREGIDTLFGHTATGIDIGERRLLLEDQSLRYDRLILASGSRPAVPPIEGVDKEGVFTFKSLADADAIASYGGETVVVVGSGPIGIEASIALKKRGWCVFLVELLDWILPRVFDREPAALLQEILEREEIEVLTRERVVRILGEGRVSGVATARREIACDLVLLVAGMVPEVELARQVGLEVGELGGLVTDEHLLTTGADIYACGDCIEARDAVSGEKSLSLLWHNAREQGEVAGYNCAGGARAYPGSLNITGVDFFGTHAVSLGSTLESLNSEHGVEVVERRWGDNYYRLVLCHGTLVGAQAIGDTRGMGALLSAVRRREKPGGLDPALIQRGFLLAPWGFLTRQHRPWC